MNAGVAIEIDVASLAAIDALVSRLAHIDEQELLTEIGALGESQTRKRIESGGPGPDGEAWKPNRAGTAILMQTGRHLHDSVAYSVGGAMVEWGASWEFAHVHQYGAVIKPKNGDALKFWFVSGGFTEFVIAKQVTIPARPFVGLSADNRNDIEEQVTDFLRRAIA